MHITISAMMVFTLLKYNMHKNGKITLLTTSSIKDWCLVPFFEPLPVLVLLGSLILSVL
jgi:hypothetical protein